MRVTTTGGILIFSGGTLGGQVFMQLEQKTQDIYVDTLCNNLPQTCLETLIDYVIENHIDITHNVASTSNCTENTSKQD